MLVVAVLGATSFLVSDSALAIGRFRGEFTGGTMLVLGSYWLAQWLIARSATRAGTRQGTRQGTR